MCDAPSNQVQLEWVQGDRQCRLTADLGARTADIAYVDETGQWVRWRA